ncbi:phosphopantetheine-binding protein [Streptomyces cinnamoneus]|uniref:acyl carrier protein n=1 Tax=Streptomyces cinnamoneus TaxID=53446 RepID=UPI003440B0E0
MTEVLNVVTRAIIGIRPDLGEAGTDITRDSALFYAADPDQPVLGLDSMEALELISVLEKEFGVELADTDIRIGDLRTVGDVVEAMSMAGTA